MNEAERRTFVSLRRKINLSLTTALEVGSIFPTKKGRY